jgi:DNA polymerase (family X)
LKNGLKIKLYTGTADLTERVFLTTGPANFIEAFQQQFPELPLTGAINEEAIFTQANIQYIPPYYRDSADSISKAVKKQVPAPLQTSSITSIIHSHSNWSDGVNTIEEMANECIRRGLEYLVISDHSKAATYAKGLSEERIREQHRYIDQLNEKYSQQSTPFKIFKSIECDILTDGSLDYTNDILATFDLIIASVHSNLKMTEEKAMHRVMAAIHNPYVTILGHMTGRLLLSRKGYPLDHKKVIDACAANNVVIELNAHPRRLDIDWQWIDYALQKNVLLSINPDAHSLDGFDDIKYGVLAAQKGGLSKEQNLSSFSLAAFENHLAKRKIEKQL